MRLLLNPRLYFLTFVFAALSLLSLDASGQKYIVTDLGTLSKLGGGQDRSEAYAINIYGEIVGYSTAPDGNIHAFLWKNGVMTDLGTLFGVGSQASSINDAGQVVGWSQLPGGSVSAGTATYMPFIWQNGVMSELGNLGGSTSEANFIASTGTVVGYSYLPGGTLVNGGFSAVIWANGATTKIVSEQWGSFATGVNPSGQVVGEYLTSPATYRAFIWQNGSLTDLGDLGGGLSSATAINAQGQVVGGSTLEYGDTEAFLWSAGTMTDLGFLGTAYAINNVGQVVGGGYGTSDYEALLWQGGVLTGLEQYANQYGKLQLTNAYGINDAGQIVGSGQYLQSTHAFLLTPNPFPRRQIVSVPHNTAKAITLTGTDSSTPPRSLTFAIKSLPAHGTLSVLNKTTGAVTYTPNNKFQGVDVFTFTVSNGIDTSAPAPITLEVAAGIPTAKAQTDSIAHNTATTVTLTGTDPDNPPAALTFAIKTEPAHGTVSGLNTSTGALTYTPGANKYGADSFTFTVSNGSAVSAPATVTLNVAPGVPSANAQSVSVAHNTAKTVMLTGKDLDNPILPLTFAIKTEPAHGTVSGLNPATGAVTYTPGANKYGPDSFTFTVSNGTYVSSPAVVTLSVTPGAPTANPQSVTVGYNLSKTITLSGSDSDNPALPLTYAIATSPLHGTLGSLNTATGQVTFTPSSNYHGVDSFTFTVSNGTYKSSPATVAITVTSGG